MRIVRCCAFSTTHSSSLGSPYSRSCGVALVPQREGVNLGSLQPIWSTDWCERGGGDEQDVWFFRYQQYRSERSHLLWGRGRMVFLCIFTRASPTANGL